MAAGTAEAAALTAAVDTAIVASGEAMGQRPERADGERGERTGRRSRRGGRRRRGRGEGGGEHHGVGNAGTERVGNGFEEVGGSGDAFPSTTKPESFEQRSFDAPRWPEGRAAESNYGDRAATREAVRDAGTNPRAEAPREPIRDSAPPTREPESRSFEFDRSASPAPVREPSVQREAPPPAATATEPREWTPTPPTDTTTARNEP
jgi:ribonuclease E